MRKIFVLFLLVVFVLLAFGVVIPVKAERDSRERYVVNLNEVSKSSKQTLSASYFSKENLLKNIDKKNVKEDFGNTLSVFLSESEKDLLLSSGIVKSIEPERYLNILLQNSTNIINASAGWNLQQSGLNLTGAGQTICIIDTGVDYTLADLGGCYGNNSISSTCKIIGGLDYCADDGDCLYWDYVPEDLNGHGTHVSGIAAANGSIKGVAPEAKLFIFKACNSTGSCATSDIKYGIDTCVSNASLYNISIISMSLGSGSYDSYCNSDSLASSINAAVVANISFVVASGNDGISTNISSPACVQNATAVGSTTKADLISSFSNRAGIMALLAPGGTNTGSGTCTSSVTDENRICSTSLGGGYISYSGTSMATPHVAGAIALMRQYLNLTGQMKTPKQIESILNSTGKKINDTATGINYSRINIYDAIISLDNQNPNVSLIDVDNGEVSVNSTQTFRCNASDLALKNVTFYLWNSTNYVYNLTSQNATGASNSFELNVSSISSDNYKWNCKYFDLNGNGAFAVSNYTFTIGGTRSDLDSPLNSSYTNLNDTNFSCSSFSEQRYSLKNVTFYLWNSSNSLIYNETENISGFSNSSVFNYTLLSEGEFKWNCLTYNNNSNNSYSINNFTLVYDTSLPNITSSSVSPGSTTSNSVSETFYYNVSDNLNLSECSLILNGNLNNSNSSLIINSSLNNISVTLGSGSYTWSINCTDLAGNVGNSSSGSFTITAESSGNNNDGGGGGGGGGAPLVASGWKESFVYGNKNVGEEIDKQFRLLSRVKLNLSGEEHSVGVVGINSSFVLVNVSSNTQQFQLVIGEERKVDANEDGYYDLRVKLNNIINNSLADISIFVINEKIIDNENLEVREESNSVEKSEENRVVILKYLPIAGGIVLVIIIIFIILGFLGKKNKGKK